MKKTKPLAKPQTPETAGQFRKDSVKKLFNRSLLTGTSGMIRLPANLLKAVVKKSLLTL